MTELAVGNVFHIDPLDLELAFKLVLHPNTSAAVVVDRRQQFCYAAKVTGAVDREEEIERALVIERPVSGVEPLVAVVGGTPGVNVIKLFFLRH